MSLRSGGKCMKLEFIQAVIERMARNSFQAKTWGITTTSALFGFLKSEFQTSPLMVLFPIALLLVFGTLDAYYLYLEHIGVCTIR